MQGVIFDFNGTLFLDDDKHLKAWGAIAKELRGYEVTEDELHGQMSGKPNLLIAQYLSPTELTPEQAKEISERKESRYRQFCKEDQENFHLIQGAQHLFDDLKRQNIPFTIASASIKPNIDFFVDSFHLDDWIDPEMIVYDDGTHADKSSMFKEAAEKLNVPVEQITIIEDSLLGIQGALQAGCKDIRLLDSGKIAEKVSDHPEIRQVVETMDEIIR